MEIVFKCVETYDTPKGNVHLLPFIEDKLNTYPGVILLDKRQEEIKSFFQVGEKYNVIFERV